MKNIASHYDLVKLITIPYTALLRLVCTEIFELIELLKYAVNKALRCLQ